MKRPRISLKRALFASSLFLIVTLIFIFYKYSLQSSISRYMLLTEYTSEVKGNQSTKHILFWTKFFDVHLWGMTKETYLEDFLQSIKCPKTNCIFTHNKNLLQHTHEYDAIIFHTAETWILMDLPETRSPRQVYIMATKE